jgi:hypothetical protein
MGKDRLAAFSDGVIAIIITIMVHEDYFNERVARANIPNALKILRRAGAGNPPIKGDELPAKRKRR